MENDKTAKELPTCCQPKKNSKNGKSSIVKGISYGLVPHIGCITFIVLSIIGATTAASVFKPLLMNSYFFYSLIGLSLIFATVSATLYLRKNKSLSFEGIKNHKNYLSIMYGTTVAVNLILFLVIFPLAVNASGFSGDSVNLNSNSSNSNSKLTLEVQIPCPGHAWLIIGELRKLNGIQDVKFKLPNLFDVAYDSSKISRKDILSANIFNEFNAKATE